MPQYNILADLTHAEVAERLGAIRQNIQQGEQRALRKLRDALLESAEEDDYFDAPKPVRSGRWNGKRIVRTQAR